MEACSNLLWLWRHPFNIYWFYTHFRFLRLKDEAFLEYNVSIKLYEQSISSWGSIRWKLLYFSLSSDFSLFCFLSFFFILLFHIQLAIFWSKEIFLIKHQFHLGKLSWCATLNCLKHLSLALLENISFSCLLFIFFFFLAVVCRLESKSNAIK